MHATATPVTPTDWATMSSQLTTPEPTHPSESTPEWRRPRGVYILAGLALVVFLVGLVGGGFESKLSGVQKNDNSAFLPGSADSTKVANKSEKFATQQVIPGFVVYQRKGGLTDADKAKINSDVAKFRTLKGVAADQVGLPEFKKDVASIAVPLVAKDNGKDVDGPALVDAEKGLLKQARNGAPAGLAVHSAGAGGLLVAFIDAFSGLDGALLGAAALVVIIILLVVYRSPVLWFFPLFGSLLALGVSSMVIYALAKSGTITLNGQSQGILSVLVIGAGTDYALLLVSRYREELHEHQSRVQAMVAAWKGAAPPILASAVTVILGLICLSFAELNSTRGLGPVCAIGIASTVTVMLTVLPALLVVSGRWIFWPRKPRVDHQTSIEQTHGVWGRVRRQGHPERPAGLDRCRAGPGHRVHRDDRAADPGPVDLRRIHQHAGRRHRAADLRRELLPGRGCARGRSTPTPTRCRRSSRRSRRCPASCSRVVCVQPDYAKLAAAFKAGGGQAVQPGADGCLPAALQVQPIDGKTLVNATLKYSYDTQPAYDTITSIRSAARPGGAGADALVGGQSAVNLDVQDASRHDRNLIIPIVLLVILVVLAMVLRALLAPLILIATVVLSFCATWACARWRSTMCSTSPTPTRRSRCSRSSSWWRWVSTTTSS